jgi:peptidoglycan/LPS O-acetylase OafA/YrhL
LAATTTLEGRPAAPATDPTTGRARRLHGLTALRFFAAAAVVLVHVRFQFSDSHTLTVAAGYGYAGVTFFFLLSGFVLTWSWSRQPAGRFFWRRLARIWPLQFALMLVAFTVLADRERLPGPFGHTLEALLLQSWSPDRAVYFGGNGVSWSLSCEMFFYLLFPFVVPLVIRLHGRGLAVLGALTGAAMLAAPALAAGSVSGDTYYWLFYVFPPYRFAEFLLGIVLARAVALGLRVRRPALAGSLSVAGLALLVAALTWLNVVVGGGVDRPFVALAAVPLFAVLLLACVSAELRSPHSWLTWRPLVLLGEWSFALYLVHKPLFLLTQRWGWWGNSGGLDGALQFVAFLALSTAVAAGAHYALEKPAERALRTLRLRPAAVPSAALPGTTAVGGIAALQARMPTPGQEFGGLMAIRR